MSKRIQVLEEIYKGMFHVTEPITNMYTLVRILIDKCAKSIPLVIELDATMDAVVVTAVQSPEKSLVRTPPATPTAAIVPVDPIEFSRTEPELSSPNTDDQVKQPAAVNHQGIQGIDVDEDFVAEASAVVDAIDAERSRKNLDTIRAPTDISVAASYTSIEVVSKSDVKTVPTEILQKVRTPQESHILETNTDPTDHKVSSTPAQMIGLESTNQHEHLSNLDDSHTTGDIETIQQLEAELTSYPNNNIGTKPETPFLPVKKGIPNRAITKSTQGFTTPFELLQDEDEDDVTHNQDELSPVLLSPKPSVAVPSKPPVVQASPQPKKTKRGNKRMSPPTGFSPRDQKLQLRATGYQYIEDHLRAHRQDQVSLEDLSWYIATSKPRMYHLREQTKRKCKDIHLQTVRDCHESCKETANYMLMDLSKEAQAECNKLNTTSANIHREMDKVKQTMDNLQDLHKMCSEAANKMDIRSTNFVTSFEMESWIDKALLRQEQKFTAIIRALEEKLQNNITSIASNQNINNTSMPDNVTSTNATNPPTNAPSRRNPLFPNVDPSLFTDNQCNQHSPSRGTPDPIHRNILPYQMKLSVWHSGHPKTCWLEKCLVQARGLLYEASTGSGERIRFKPSDILHVDKTTALPPAPPGYIVECIDLTTGDNALGMTCRPCASPTCTSPSCHHSPVPSGPPYYHGVSAPPHEDDGSTYSSHHDEERIGPNGGRKLPPNAYHYPRTAGMGIIREDKINTLAKDFSVNLPENEDPRQFYTDVRQYLQPHKVLLRAYNDITTTSGLLKITADNCLNFESAGKVMSRFLYNFFYQGRDNMFDNNAYAYNSLVAYGKEQNGLGFLFELIKASHQELRVDATQSNITELYTLPKYLESESVWTYVQKLEVYVQEVMQNMSQVDVLRLIYDQLKLDMRFKTANGRIEEIISKYKHGAGSVPPEYRLNNILQTIMGMYPLKEKQRLSLPRRPGATAHMVDAPTITVHRARTRSQTNATSGTSQTEQRPVREKKNEFCISCLTHGHSDINCTKTGAHLSIEKYLQRCPQDKRAEIVKMYKQNRKAAHERYLQSYQARKDLKRRIRRLEFEHFPTEQSRLELDPDQLHHFDQLRVSYINAAKDGNPDLDFW